MTYSENVASWCNANKAEVIFRYDAKARDWYVHLYASKRTANSVDIEFRSSSVERALVELTEKIWELRKGKRNDKGSK